MARAADNGPFWEIRPPPQLPKRWNEDIRRRSGVYHPDNNPTHPLNEQNESDSYPYPSDNASGFSGYVNRVLPIQYSRFIIGHIIQFTLLIGPVAFSCWWFSDPHRKDVWIPPKELPYFEDDVPNLDQVMASVPKWALANPYTDRTSRKNPMYYPDYKPSEPPSLAEAYPNGY
eukprot:CAMPEP_0198734738 /NCGR_PEP_ID=MMETSP1475-20131203/54874_1 /TAXON_ID= ORGANISM="Unidentified sp., Strain CCMP1999" /NCGR_SAMPLE_ID=MMETSP1475 /ASSEMBLY_ACC=CAM_ASM_001111 /LENGTH=172 /DNA_ID=CAMNT_0044498271 /DNA_START=176 /DNA_END=694 /DNA_ORIENTATION=-